MAISKQYHLDTTILDLDRPWPTLAKAMATKKTRRLDQGRVDVSSLERQEFMGLHLSEP